MFKFLIKKSFFDLWDNLLPSFVHNIIFMAVIALYLFAVRLTYSSPVYVFFILSAVFLLILSILVFGITAVTTNWSDYKSSSFFEDFSLPFLKKTSNIVLFFIILAFIIACAVVFIPYYMSLHSYIGIILGVVLFWSCLFLGIALLFYPSLTVREKKGPFRTLAVSVKFVVDNKSFSLLVSIFVLIIFLLSSLSFFVIPGITGISVILTNAAKLILIRYSYTSEKHLTRDSVDVRDMLLEEESNLGKRTIRNTLFPWKNLK